jgi:putative ABC transport system permease protein
MGVPLVRGRLLTDRDDAGAPAVVIVNQAAARRFWPGQDAINRQLTFAANFGPAGKTASATRQVAGVVGDIRHYGLDQGVEPEIYFPSFQSTWRWANLVIRTTGEPLSLAPAVRRTVRGLDAGLAVGKLRTSRQLLADSVAKPRFTTLLMLTFAVLALVVAGVGVYGAVAYSVGQRTRELAVRMSVGAGHGDIFRLILGEGVLLGVSGLGVGLAGALVLARLMAGLLFEVSPLDPATFAVVFLALIALVAVASFLPARHAARVDPMAGLRHE